jgi:outer membrane protein assembly factor BamB
MVFFLSSDTYLYAIHAADGLLAWKYQAQPDGQPTDYGSNPTVSNGIVYINTSAYLVALDAATGALKWQNYIDFYSSDNSPTVVGGVVYDPTFNGGAPVVAFDAATGSLIRNFSGGIGRGNPAIVGGVVYATDENHLLDAWDAQTGTLLFGFFVSIGNGGFAGPGNSPTYYAGKVYIGGADGIFAIDAVTGALLWQNSTAGVGASPPVAGDNLVFVITGNNYLIACDAVTGVLQWSLPGNFLDNENPTFANGTLYVGTLDGSLIAITASTGQKKWTFQQSGAVYSGACIVDGSGVAFHPTASGDQQ